MNKEGFLNILFTATWISILVTAVLTLICTYLSPNPNAGMISIIIGPIMTYIIGRILCNKEYK